MTWGVDTPSWHAVDRIALSASGCSALVIGGVQRDHSTALRLHSDHGPLTRAAGMVPGIYLQALWALAPDAWADLAAAVCDGLGYRDGTWLTAWFAPEQPIEQHRLSALAVNRAERVADDDAYRAMTPAARRAWAEAACDAIEARIGPVHIYMNLDHATSARHYAGDVGRLAERPLVVADSNHHVPLPGVYRRPPQWPAERVVAHQYELDVRALDHPNPIPGVPNGDRWAPMRPLSEMHAPPKETPMYHPRIVTRPEWGARGPKPGLRAIPHPVRDLYIHHTAGSTPTNVAQSSAVMRAVQGFHMDTRGMLDAAYTTAADIAGNLYECRARVGVRPAVGGHTAGHNSTGLAIVALGTFGRQFTPELLKSIAWWIVLAQFAGWLTPDVRIRGHREVVPTSCPGDLQGLLPLVRLAVADPATHLAA